jgi:methylenetetrahydrofolate reductase (NADPH)
MSISNRFKDALLSGAFAISCEVIPGRGAREDAQSKALEAAQGIWDTGRVHAVSITDNPGGNPALLADRFAMEFSQRGIDAIVHMTCKDRSRNQLLSQLYALERGGIANILAMTGDYPASGWHGRSRPVFDLDPVQMLQMLGEMNGGLAVRGPRGETVEQPCHFFAGAVTSPFKWTEAETLTQYFKLEKKVAAGARFIISQLGFDARKMHELLLYMQAEGLDVPAIANVYLLNAGAARMMRRGAVAGCYVSDDLARIIELESESADKGAAARLDRAAKMVAVARGMGYAGAHIGGMGLTAELVCEVLDRAEDLSGDWQALARELSFGKPDGFYLFKPRLDSSGKNTGLNALTRSPRTDDYSGRDVMRGYGLSRFFHYWALTEGRRGNRLLQRRMKSLEKAKGRSRRHSLEHLAKAAIYGCMDCGDCGLEALAYSCPMRQCPKSQRNGPCGGSMDGWCEAYPQERRCIYFKAYHRLKKSNALHMLQGFITSPNNWDLDTTSSWGNYAQKRDNAASRKPLGTGQDRRGEGA